MNLLDTLSTSSYTEATIDEVNVSGIMNRLALKDIYNSITMSLPGILSQIVCRHLILLSTASSARFKDPLVRTNDTSSALETFSGSGLAYSL